VALTTIAGCGLQDPSGARPGQQDPQASNPDSASKSLTLAEARKGFKTNVAPGSSAPEPLPRPPANQFQLIQFPAPTGKLAAYLTTLSLPPNKKSPAIIWITGGDCNSIGDVWSPQKPSNDQTASAFRKAGIIMMFPSLRGGNNNPGKKEGFYGEVDDVLAAADYLTQQSYVDPQRIYLGGHSTGGTLVLLVAEMSNRFRAVFSFGPVSDVNGYPPEFLPIDRAQAREMELRSPGRWLHCVTTPVFVLEGQNQGNVGELSRLRGVNPLVQANPVKGFNHFSVLAPTTKLLAQKILKDDGPTCNITISEQELAQLSTR
jgi:dipeptidyl aminopeptidase/acylaminoacyl peptidase